MTLICLQKYNIYFDYFILYNKWNYKNEKNKR